MSSESTVVTNDQPSISKTDLQHPTHDVVQTNSTGDVTPSPICKRSQNVHMLSLREHNNKISSTICSLLNVTDISLVSTVAIKNSNKLPKQVLAEYLLKSIKLTDFVCSSKSINTISESSNNVPFINLDSIHEVVTKAVSNSLESKHFNQLNQQVQSLQAKLDSFSDISSNVIEHAVPPMNAKFPINHKPLSDIKNPTKHVEDNKPDFIDENLCTELMDFLQKEAKFTKLKGRSVTTYGEAYPYPGSPPAKSTPIPPIINQIINKIEGDFPGSNLNSCLITEYAGISSQIPEHSDDEPVISPESNIFTLSIGDPRTIIFRDLCSGAEKSLQPESLSLYVMSRASQNLWKHRIDPPHEDGATPRYSFTFRSLSNTNKSSTIILGDSNTKHIKFGIDRGSLGKKLPGRREPVYHIGQIDPSICLGYQNVLVHVAINDMRNYSPGRNSGDPAPSDIDSHIKRLAEKLERIQILCPNASITVSPALPTKISSLNRRAMAFNVKLVEYVKVSNPNIIILDFESFAPNGHALGDEFCCFKNKNDRIHLGMTGIRKLAKIFIESLTLPRNFVDERSYSDVVSGESGHTQIKSDHE